MHSSHKRRYGDQDGFTSMLEREASKRARIAEVGAQGGEGEQHDDLFDNFANRYESILKGHESEIMGQSFRDETDDEEEEEGLDDEDGGEVRSAEKGVNQRGGLGATSDILFPGTELQGNERLKSRLSRIYQRAANEVHFPTEGATPAPAEWEVERKRDGGSRSWGGGVTWREYSGEPRHAGAARSSAWPSSSQDEVDENERRTKMARKPTAAVVKPKKKKEAKTKKKVKKKAKKAWKRLTKHKPSLVRETFDTPHEKSTLQGMVSAKEHLALKHKLRKARSDVRELKKKVGELEYAAKRKKKGMVKEREKHKATRKQLEIQEKLMLQVLERFKAIELECRARNDLGLDRREG